MRWDENGLHVISAKGEISRIAAIKNHETSPVVGVTAHLQDKLNNFIFKIYQTPYPELTLFKRKPCIA